MLDRRNFHAPPRPRPYFVAAEIADAVGQTFVRDNFQNRQLARGEVRPSLKALGKGLDTVSMPNERTHAYLPRDAHPTGDGPAGSIKSDQGKPCKSWKVRDPPLQVRSTQQLYSSGGRPVGNPIGAPHNLSWRRNSGNYFAIERFRKNALSFARESRFGTTIPVAGL